MAFCKGRGTAGRGIGIGPYESACRGGRPCPPGPDNATPCRAGPVCPAGGAGKESPSHGFAVPGPFRQEGYGGRGNGLPRPVTRAKEIRVSFRDQSADWSWESVIPLYKSKGDADCHSRCAHRLRNDMVFTRGAVQNQRADRGVRPYGG